MTKQSQPYLRRSIAEKELSTLFKEYYERLVFFSFQIVRNQQQAEDITQDAFIIYWRQKKLVTENQQAIKNFLYRTVKNASLNIIRHNIVVDKFRASEIKDEPSEPSIMEAIISSEIIAEVHHAISSLPIHLQKVAQLSFLEGKKNQEIADELKTSINTIKKQKQRTLELLKLKLQAKHLILILYISLFSTQR